MNIFKQKLSQYNIILASSSPRRKQLLSSIGIEFEIIPPNIDEKKMHLDIPAQNYCQSLSVAKAINVYQATLKPQNIPQIIISADTIVVLENKIINKPKDNNEAIFFLKILSNKKHQVFTGVCVLNCNNGKLICNYRKTDVYFRKLFEQEIIDYVNTGNSLDKAGGYGIQDDYGCFFVKKIDGCYNNVVGIPLELLYEMISISIK